MAGGTLFVSRAVKLHGWIKRRLAELGFDDVTVTDTEKDGLNFLIRDMKPRLVLIGSKFYQCCTPFMTAGLHKQFPKLNIAAVSLTEFPDDLAMYFIINGAKSYVNFWDGDEQFYKGLTEIREGREFVSEEVQRRMDMREVYPEPSGAITERQIEILRLVANGWTGEEIADVLFISHGTVENSKSDIYVALNVRNGYEAIRVALCLGIIKQEELFFFGRNYVLRPLPQKQINTRGLRK
jgi:DNA-binding NarL/FixJ family response regulator